MKTKPILVFIAIVVHVCCFKQVTLSTLVDYLLLKQESILEHNQDRKGHEEQIIHSFAEKVDPDDLVQDSKRQCVSK